MRVALPRYIRAMLLMANSQEDAARIYPYDSLAESDDYDEALDELRASRKDGRPHIPTFTQRMLERLRDVGLLHLTDAEPPVNVRKAKLDKEQEVWIRFDTRRDDEGYIAVEVVDAPRSDTAILAAMTAWLTWPIDFKQLLEAQQFIFSGAYEDEMKRIGSIGATLRRTRLSQDIVNALFGKMMKIHLDFARPFLTRMGRTEEDRDMTSAIFPETGGDQQIAPGNAESAWDKAVSAWKSLDDLEAKIIPLRHLEYLLPLIHYYRPEFDNRSPEEQQDLLKKACDYINGFLESLRNLQAFLEYGAPNQKKLTPAIKEPKRDVKAAVLHDVDELTHRQIGERMKIPLPPISKEKGGHVTVREMVKRGRGILEEAFGKVGWWERVERMKAEKARWWSLSEEERDKQWDAETTALQFGISIEEARRWTESRHP